MALGRGAFIGIMYYRLAISKDGDIRNIAFFMKISMLLLSFWLTFTQQKYIIIKDLAFGGRSSVMIIAVIEIADAFIDRRKNLPQKQRRAVLRRRSRGKYSKR